MKKFLVVLIILFLVSCGFVIYSIYSHESIPKLKIQDTTIDIDKLYIYGTHFNIHGNYTFPDDAELVLYNGEFISYALNIKENEFNLSDLLNDGIYLDNIPIGEYYLFIRVKNNDIKDEEDIWNYFALSNISGYKETTYYTMSNYNKKILIRNEANYPTMKMIVARNYDKNIYDIVIDPGHGGMDGGASKNGYKETDFTLDISTKIKKSLENEGFKVKLTHEIGQLNKTEKLSEYGKLGRAVLPREISAKFLFSIHLNSSNYSSVSGLEIYTAKNINYNLASLLVNNITSATGLNISNNKINRVQDGVYSRNFTTDEINESLKKYTDDNLIPYDISTESNYYYMIRETGGIVTGAYVDDRNSIIVGNPFVNSNVGTESYLLELGYLSNKNDLDNILNKKEEYIVSIVNSIKTLYDDKSQ